jgi:hypothetical protein
MWLTEFVEECSRTVRTLTTVDGESVPLFILREFNDFMDQVLPPLDDGKDGTAESK